VANQQLALTPRAASAIVLTAVRNPRTVRALLFSRYVVKPLVL
jgi:hypothetical protein